MIFVFDNEKLIAPEYSKSEILKAALITSHQFANWTLRGHLPLATLGYERTNLTNFKYSLLVAAYCQCLSLHSGKNKKTYISILKKAFADVAKFGFHNEHETISISAWGKGKHCGRFENEGEALKLSPNQHLHIPVGKIIKTHIQIAEDKSQC